MHLHALFVVFGCLAWTVYDAFKVRRHVSSLALLCWCVGKALFGMPAWMCMLMQVAVRHVPYGVIEQHQENELLRKIRRGIDVLERYLTIAWVEIEKSDYDLHNMGIEIEYKPLDGQQLKKASEIANTVADRERMIYSAIGVIMAFSIGKIGLAFVLAVASVIYFWRVAPTFEQKKFPTKEIGFRDGMYEAHYCVLGFRVAKATGVAWRGVLHLNFHLAGNTCVNYGGEMIEPSYVDEVMDLVTWGGPPQIRNPIDGERLIVVYLPKLNEACVIASSYQEVCTGKGFFKGPATIPGLSGGAVFGVSRIPGDGEVFSDEVELIGLAGTNISSRGLSTFYGDEDVTWQVEYMQHRTETTIDLGDEPGYIKMAQIMQSPGTGKTRQHVPRMAFQALQAGVQVVVSPPTRVICGEVATLLDEIPGARVTRNWRGGLRRRDWNIMVTPHAVLFRLLYLRSGMLKKQTVFFIDEAHFSDTKTIALCKFLRHRVEETLDTAIFLTATGKDWKTGQDRICDISNYPIADHDIPSHNVVQFVEDHLRSWMGKKVIVFCNSVGGEGLSIRTFWRKLRNNPAADVIAFSRNTFERNYPLVKKDPEMDKAMIVLTTNMSECGININADIVVDTGQQVAFKVKNGCVVRSMERTTMAQQVQRRGRVGRRKPGDYYKVVSHEPQYTISRPMEIEEIEALVLCDKAGIPLTHLEKCKVDALGLVVTDSQIVRWLDGETQSLIGATVVYDTEGNIRTASGRAALINSWKDRGEIVNFGSRKVRLRYYDARDRELFVKALKLGGIKDEEHEEEHQDKCEACGTLWYHHFDGRSCRSKCPTCVCEEVEAAELAKIADDVE